MADLGTPYPYWVCTDCYFCHHGTSEEERGEAYPENVLSLIPEDAEVTAGMMWEEHAEDCPNRIAGENVDECECEQITFTWSSCEGCGSALGGSRDALTVWIHEEAT